MRLALKALNILLICWIVLAETTSGVSGMVLCIGSDARLSLESGSEGHCRSTTDTHDHQQHTDIEKLVGASLDDCEDCIDVPLFTKTVSQLAKKVRRNLLSENRIFRPSVQHCAVFSDTDVLINRIASLKEARHRPSCSLLAQRTVLLRI